MRMPVTVRPASGEASALLGAASDGGGAGASSSGAGPVAVALCAVLGEVTGSAPGRASSQPVSTPHARVAAATATAAAGAAVLLRMGPMVVRSPAGAVDIAGQRSSTLDAVHDADDVLARLRRHPDVEAPNLFAVDAADRLILDAAAEFVDDATDGRVAVVGDAYGALTLGLAARHDLRRVRVHQDLLTGELALAGNARTLGLSDRYTPHPLSAELLDGVRLVLMRLPRALSGLAEIAEAVARHADPGVVVIAGGRDKYLTKTMNDVLAQHFGEVTASRGRQKSRTLTVRGPKPVGEPAFPIRERLAELDIEVVAHGAAFSGARLDIGTRFLLDHLKLMKP